MTGADGDDAEMEELVSDSFLRLSPPPSERDYYFHLDENEGLTDLFDMPISSFWPPSPPHCSTSDESIHKVIDVHRLLFFFFTLRWRSWLTSTACPLFLTQKVQIKNRVFHFFFIIQKFVNEVFPSKKSFFFDKVLFGTEVRSQMMIMSNLLLLYYLPTSYLWSE